VLILNAYLGTQPLAGGYDDAQVGVLRHVLLVWMVTVTGKGIDPGRTRLRTPTGAAWR